MFIFLSSFIIKWMVKLFTDQINLPLSCSRKILENETKLTDLKIKRQKSNAQIHWICLSLLINVEDFHFLLFITMSLENICQMNTNTNEICVKWYQLMNLEMNIFSKHTTPFSSLINIFLERTTIHFQENVKHGKQSLPSLTIGKHFIFINQSNQLIFHRIFSFF